MVTLGNPILEGFERRVLELNDLSAIETNQVIVVASLQSRFISRLAVFKFSSGGETQPGQELEGSVDGDVADFGVDFNNLSINLRETLVAG